MNLPVESVMPQTKINSNNNKNNNSNKNVVTHRLNQKTIASIVQNIHQSPTFQDTLNNIVVELKYILGVSRAAIYQLNKTEELIAIAEALQNGFTPVLGAKLPLVAFGAKDINDYITQPYSTVHNLPESDLSPYQQQIINQYQMDASLAVPIWLNDYNSFTHTYHQERQLWGLLVVQQCRQTRQWNSSELNMLSQISLELSLSLQKEHYAHQLRTQIEQGQTINKITNQLRESLAVDDIFKNVTQEVRKALNTDRSVVYQFNADWTGQVVAESVGMGWVSLLVEQSKDTVLSGDRTSSDRCILRKWSTKDIVNPDTFLQQTKGGRYVQGQKFTAVDDIYAKNFSACYIESLEKYQVKAYLIAPIFQGEKLWGLLGVYENKAARQWEPSEIELVTQIANQLALALKQGELITQIKNRSQELTLQTEREEAIIQFSARLVSRLAGLAQENSDPLTILKFATNELRQVLKTDRVAVFQFYPDWSGEFVIESVGQNWPKLVGSELAVVNDTYLQQTKGGRYVRRESLRVNDIYQSGFDQCHLNQIEQWEAKALMIAPIFKGEQLWGLLGVYQNDRPRVWDASELAISEQVATQIGVALQLGEYLSQVRSQEQQLAEIAERERNARELLEREAMGVLTALEPSFHGDLTVRAPLSATEIGTIADGYNTTIQSLRQLVRQVQVAATSVSDTSSQNNLLVANLSTQAQQELDQLATALKEVDLMVVSSQKVADFAHLVEEAVNQANQTVQAGDNLMENTVSEILAIRSTVSETAKKIKRLGETFQKISKVVNLIENFATQTNLLALNAAIEATRAGQYGKGFAVVADEVRSLAYQSANATTEISRLVDEIRTGTQEVTEAMEEGIAQVVQGTQLVNQSRESLSEIVLATDRISELVTAITEASTDQTEQSQRLTTVMTDVSSLAYLTSDSASKLAESFQNLLTTSQQLETSVSKFKVD